MGATGDLPGSAVAAAMDAEHLATLIETSASAFIRLDRDWRFTYINRRGEALLQRQREDLVGRNVWDVFPTPADSPWRLHYQEALDTGREVTFEAEFAPISSWFEVRANPDAGGLLVFLLDVSARRRAQDRLNLVAEITQLLVGNRDVDSVAATLATAVVPELATWAVVSLYDDEGRLYEATAAHSDPARADDVARLETLHPQLMQEMSVVTDVTASREPQLLRGLAPHIRARAAEGIELYEVLDRLGCDAMLMLPLRARNRPLGALALLRGEGEPDLAADLELAVGLADRAGLALENAQLYSRQRRTAEVLQRSLLTPLPQPDQLELVGRYLPAAQSTEVGGDWYDAFLQPDGSTMLVIGDIVGHDIAAAAAMGQLRNLLRGTAYDRGDGPAQLLVRLDRLVEGLGVDTLATLVVGRLSRADEGGRRRLRWSNAGHPPPMLRRADGSVETLEREADLLLGMSSDHGRHEHEVPFAAGDTLLLYTDGLVERRGRALGDGLRELALAWATAGEPTAAATHDAGTRGGGTPLDLACDQLLGQLLTEQPFDDVALLAVHAHSPLGDNRSR